MPTCGMDRRATEGSSRSPTTSVTPGLRAPCHGSLSRLTTSKPPPTSAATTSRPSRPAPPVTSTAAMDRPSDPRLEVIPRRHDPLNRAGRDLPPPHPAFLERTADDGGVGLREQLDQVLRCGSGPDHDGELNGLSNL